MYVFRILFVLKSLKKTMKRWRKVLLKFSRLDNNLPQNNRTTISADSDTPVPWIGDF